jgi:hypothetical protein
MGGKSGSWAVTDVVEGLEEPASPDSTPLVLNAAAVIATQFVRFAGEVLVREVDDAKWRTWAAKLRNIADNPPANAEWDLQNHARKAYERMIELRPELFQEVSN